jgi:hypothetical protein
METHLYVDGTIDGAIDGAIDGGVACGSFMGVIAQIPT